MRARRRRCSVVAATVGVLLAVLVPPVSVHAEGSDAYWRLALSPAAFEVDGTTYRVRLNVLGSHDCYVNDDDEYGCHHKEFVQVVVTSRHHSSIASARQRYLYQARLWSKNARHDSDRLSTAAVVTSTEQTPRLDLNLRFMADGPMMHSCGGHVRSRAGTVTGSLRFRPPQSQIGNITTIARRAVLTHSDGTCDLQRAHYPDPWAQRDCKDGTFYIHGYERTGSLHLIAYRDPDAGTATLIALHGGYDGYFSIKATVPANHVRVADDLSSLTLRGAPGSYFRGTATADQPTEPATPTTIPGCSGGAGIERDVGMLNGDLTPLFWAGRTRSAETVDIDARAYHQSAAAPTG